MIYLILILGFVVRLVNINQSLWLDEASQVLMSQKSIYSILFERVGDFHPPLSYLIFHYWLMLGQSEIWLRLLPIIFGVATIFVVYKLCQKLFNEKLALISALFLSLAPYHVYYSQEIRMYSITTFFASLSMYYLITKKCFGYVVVTSALIYTHYMGFFLLAAQVFYKRDWRLLGIISLTFLPWLPFLYEQLQNGVKASEYLPGWEKLLSVEPIKAVPLTFIKFSIGRINFEPQILYLGISVVVLAFLGFLIFRAIKLEKSRLPLFWLFVPIVLAWLISFILPMNQPFRLLFTLPAFCMLLSIGVGELGKFWRLGLCGVLVISIAGLLIYWINPKFQREDWRTATKEVPNGVFAWPLPFDPYTWYGGQGVGLLKHLPARENEIEDSIKNLGTEVYLFEYLQDLSDPGRLTQKKLIENGYKLEKTLNYNGVGFVYKFAK